MSNQETVREGANPNRGIMLRVPKKHTEIPSPRTVKILLWEDGTASVEISHVKMKSPKASPTDEKWVWSMKLSSIDKAIRLGKELILKSEITSLLN